jgi:hypothetical protein
MVYCRARADLVEVLTVFQAERDRDVLAERPSRTDRL